MPQQVNATNSNDVLVANVQRQQDRQVQQNQQVQQQVQQEQRTQEARKPAYLGNSVDTSA